MDGGLDWVDTLHILRGEFEYTTALARNATFYILYPNSDELVLWAHNGDDIVIDGDAQNLAKVKVTGNEENELYTDFRQHLTTNDTTTLRRASAAFIRQHPQSPVSLYLFEKHFLQCAEPLPQDSVKRLYQVLRKALPQDNDVALLGGRVQQRYVLQNGKAMPNFALTTTDSVRHKLSDYKGKRLLIYFWAGWINSTQGIHQTIADSLEKQNDLRALSYSLDIDSLTFQVTKGDSALNIPTYCDFMGFQSPLVKQLGLTQLPLAVLVDEKGKILRVDKEVTKVLKK